MTSLGSIDSPYLAYDDTLLEELLEEFLAYVEAPPGTDLNPMCVLYVPGIDVIPVSAKTIRRQGSAEVDVQYTAKLIGVKLADNDDMGVSRGWLAEYTIDVDYA